MIPQLICTGFKMVVGLTALLLALVTLVSVSGTYTKTQNKIEIRAFVDRYAFDRWKSTVTSPSNNDQQRVTDTTQHMTNVTKLWIAETAVIFKDMFETYDTNQGVGTELDLQLVGIEFIRNENITHPGDVTGNRTVNMSTLLNRFNAWLHTKNYSEVDHSILLTGLDLNGTRGVSNQGSMCDQWYSQSAAEVFQEGYVVNTIAHELGHSLGADHDGQGNTCDNNTNVMAGVWTVFSDVMFKFSQCSWTSITQKLNALRSDAKYRDCVTKNAHPNQLQDNFVQHLENPDRLCKRIFGQHWTFDRTVYGKPFENNECVNLFCRNPNSGIIKGVGPASGLLCGGHKECKLGFCQ